MTTGSEQVRVWDPLVRIFHWGLVTMVLVAWITHEGPALVHDGAGYVALALVSFRLVWGVVGSEHARFTSFIRSPGVMLDYARRLRAGTEPRYLGHNPLGGWMILALLATAFGASLTGWLLTTDRFWGVAWVELSHGLLADLILILAALHVAGVVLTSRRHKESLIAAMFHGQKARDPQR